MREDELTPQQLARIKDSEAALIQHIARVNIDMPSALPRLHAEPPLQERIGEAEFMGAIRRTLEGLPDEAGTDAFVVAYMRERTGSDAPA